MLKNSYKLLYPYAVIAWIGILLVSSLAILKLHQLIWIGSQTRFGMKMKNTAFPMD